MVDHSSRTGKRTANPVNTPQSDAGKNGIAMQRKEAPKGDLPSDLQSGLEGMSGMDMSDVTVNYNSTTPGDYGAHAITQGKQIDIAPGQEQHLPHEAWHVVQQKQGRVPVTGSMGGTPVNTDTSLESEADVMGARAMQMKKEGTKQSLPIKTSGLDLIQLKSKVSYGTQYIKQAPHLGPLEVGYEMRASLDPDKPVVGSTPCGSKDHDNLMDELADHNAGFLRGHLLNNNLGGRGLWNNLFPITKNANAAHLEVAERYAKQYVLDCPSGGRVKYNVTVMPQNPNDFYNKPNAFLVGEVWQESIKNGPKTKEHGFKIHSNQAIKTGQNDALGKKGWGSEGSGGSKKLSGKRIKEDYLGHPFPHNDGENEQYIHFLKIAGPQSTNKIIELIESNPRVSWAGIGSLLTLLTTYGLPSLLSILGIIGG